MKKSRLFARLGFLIAALLIEWAGSAHALLPKGQYSETEKAGFAFYRLAGLKPGFRDWVRESDDYSQAPPQERGRILEEQVYRLEKGYRNFHPDEDLVKVSRLAAIEFPAISADDLMTRYHDVKPVTIKISNDEMMYFPFQLGKTWISILPSDEKQVENITVSNDIYEKIKSNIHWDPDLMSRGAYVEIYLRPRKADFEKPAIIGNVESWMMTGDVASLEMWNRDHDVFLWSWSAPWFLSDRAGELLDLYSK